MLSELRANPLRPSGGAVGAMEKVLILELQ